MDTITHGLTGSLLATAVFVDRQSGLRDKSASYSLIIGSVFPDSDFIFSLFDDLAPLKYHRGFTHSIIGTLVFSFLWALLFTKLSSDKNFKKLFCAFASGVVLHISMDVITPFGTMILLPFSHTRVSLDYFFIIDLTFSAIVFFPQLIAFYHKSGRKALIARIGLALLAGYLLFAMSNRLSALARTEAIIKEKGIQIIRTATFPRPPAAWYWTSIIETPTEYQQIWFNNINKDKVRWEYHQKAENDPFIRKAEQLELVKIFRVFARFPQIVRVSSNGLEIVEYSDLRFGTIRGRNPFHLRVIFDGSGDLKEVTFSHRHIPTKTRK